MFGCCVIIAPVHNLNAYVFSFDLQVAKFYERGQMFLCVDCGDVADGFPMLVWTDIITKFHSGDQADKPFKAEWDKAKLARVAKMKRLQDIEVLPAWQQSHVDRHSTCGVRISCWYKFCPEDEYSGHFGLAPLLSRLFPLLLEDGLTVAQGLLVRPTADAESVDALRHMRDFEIFRQFDHTLCEQVLAPHHVIPPAEPADTLKAAHTKYMAEQKTASSLVYVC